MRLATAKIRIEKPIVWAFATDKAIQAANSPQTASGASTE
jgi:hypothetical protein